MDGTRAGFAHYIGTRYSIKEPIPPRGEKAPSTAPRIKPNQTKKIKTIRISPIRTAKEKRPHRTASHPDPPPSFDVFKPSFDDSKYQPPTSDRGRHDAEKTGRERFDRPDRRQRKDRLEGDVRKRPKDKIRPDLTDSTGEMTIDGSGSLFDARPPSEEEVDLDNTVELQTLSKIKKNAKPIPPLVTIPDISLPTDRGVSHRYASHKDSSHINVPDKNLSDKFPVQKNLSDKNLSDKNLSDKNLFDKNLSDKNLSDKNLSDKNLSDKAPVQKNPSRKDAPRDAVSKTDPKTSLPKAAKHDEFVPPSDEDRPQDENRTRRTENRSASGPPESTRARLVEAGVDAELLDDMSRIEGASFPWTSDYNDVRFCANLRTNVFPLVAFRARSKAHVVEIERASRKHNIVVCVKYGYDLDPSYRSVAKPYSFVLIDQSRREKIEVSTERKMTLVEPGVKLSSLAERLSLDGFGLQSSLEDASVVDCFRNSRGSQPRSRGWLCDALLEVEIVLPNGQLVRANKNVNPDMLWLMKGSVGQPMPTVLELVYEIYPSSQEGSYRYRFEAEAPDAGLMAESWALLSLPQAIDSCFRPLSFAKPRIAAQVVPAPPPPRPPRRFTPSTVEIPLPLATTEKKPADPSPEEKGPTHATDLPARSAEDEGNERGERQENVAAEPLYPEKQVPGEDGVVETAKEEFVKDTKEAVAEEERRVSGKEIEREGEQRPSHGQGAAPEKAPESDEMESDETEDDRIAGDDRLAGDDVEDEETDGLDKSRSEDEPSVAAPGKRTCVVEISGTTSLSKGDVSSAFSPLFGRGRFVALAKELDEKTTAATKKTEEHSVFDAASHMRSLALLQTHPYRYREIKTFYVSDVAVLRGLATVLDGESQPPTDAERVSFHRLGGKSKTSEAAVDVKKFMVSVETSWDDAFDADVVAEKLQWLGGVKKYLASRNVFPIEEKPEAYETPGESEQRKKVRSRFAKSDRGDQSSVVRP